MLSMFFKSYKQPELVSQDPYLAESINLTGELTQVIGGESITRPCWLWEDVYKYPNGQEAFRKWRKLDIKYVRPATDPQDATVNLYDTFKDLGYNATGSYRTANIEEAIVDDGVSVKVRFGARTMGTFTESPSSFTCTYRISFNCSIETVTIDGVDKLHGATHKVISDRIEAGSYAVAAAITRGKIELINALPSTLNLALGFSCKIEAPI